MLVRVEERGVRVGRGGLPRRSARLGVWELMLAGEIRVGGMEGLVRMMSWAEVLFDLRF